MTEAMQKLKAHRRFYPAFDGWEKAAVMLPSGDMVYRPKLIMMSELLRVVAADYRGGIVSNIPMYVAEEDGVLLYYPAPDRDYELVECQH